MSLGINYSAIELRILERMLLQSDPPTPPVPANPLKHCSWMAFYYGYWAFFHFKATRQNSMAENFSLLYGTRYGSQNVSSTS